jgi:hypothetical protein
MKPTHFLIFFILFLLASCKTDTKTAQNSHTFNGHWDLVNAELNGEEAPSLEKIYYEFGGVDSVKTNFTLSEQEETGTFSIEEDRLIQKTAEPIEFQIVNKTDTTLEMTTALRGFDFKLQLKKSY